MTMKAKMKYEIADAAGMSKRTLSRWLQVHRKELEAQGITKCQKLLPPRAVAFVCRELGVDEEDFR